jgi:hypothetical protein
MAARRLLIVMLVLLGLSTLAAALIPPRTTQDAGTTTGTTEETESVATEKAPKGAFVPGVVAVEPKGISLLSVSAGDQVQLAVCWSKPDEVEVPSFGLVDPVAPAKPARFDLLFEEPGTYGVKLVDADRVVARIKVGPRQPADELGTIDPDRLTGTERRCAESAGFL